MKSIGQPHIIVVVADDLGFTDVPFTSTGSEVHTPTLSALASRGIVLDNYYVQPLCTPTRAAFMTGKLLTRLCGYIAIHTRKLLMRSCAVFLGRHPVQLGLQHGVILNSMPDAVPPNETMLPALLRSVGYKTHIVGKWHLGFHEPRFTPERRGFDTAFGYYTGNAEYWNHTSPCWGCGNYTSIDLHYANATTWHPVTNASGVYSTELFATAAVDLVHAHAALHGCSAGSAPLFLYAAFEAVHGAASCFVTTSSASSLAPDCENPTDDELQVPERYIDGQRHIARRQRRRYAAMVGALDEAVANLTAAVETAGLASRALLLFSTDNGAPFKHLGGSTMSNW